MSGNTCTNCGGRGYFENAQWQKSQCLICLTAQFREVRNEAVEVCISIAKEVEEGCEGCPIKCCAESVSSRLRALLIKPAL